LSEEIAAEERARRDVEHEPAPTKTVMLRAYMPPQSSAQASSIPLAPPVTSAVLPAKS
jgi:hypothetical protein